MGRFIAQQSNPALQRTGEDEGVRILRVKEKLKVVLEPTPPNSRGISLILTMRR
jgi:hypothetical protein